MAGQPIIDIAIITVLSEEYHAVKKQLVNPEPAPFSSEQPNNLAEVVGEIPNPRSESSYSVILAMIGRAGTSQGAVATLHVISRWKPRYVFIVGIAGGFDLDGLRTGDIVIADTIYGYEYGKVEEAFIPRNEWTYHTDLGLRNGMMAFSKTNNDWLDDISIVPPSSFTPKVLCGHVASGDKVIDNPTNTFFDQATQHWPKLQAVEMEGAGAALAIQWAQSSGIRVGFLMVRGISDMPRAIGDSKKRGTKERDSWKEFAADAAAAFTVAYIAEGLPVPPQKRIVSGKVHEPFLELSTDIDFSPPNTQDILAGAKRSWFVRLKVANSGTVLANDCVGRLLTVLDEYGIELKKFSALDLYWTRQDSPENYSPVDINGPNDHTFLDIGQVKESEDIFTIRAVIPRGQRLVEVPGLPQGPNLQPGIYFMQIGIYAKNAVIPPTWFRVEWEANYSGQPCNIEIIEAEYIKALRSQEDSRFHEETGKPVTRGRRRAIEVIRELSQNQSMNKELPEPAEAYVEPLSKLELVERQRKIVSDNISVFLNDLRSIGIQATATHNIELAEERFSRLSRKIQIFIAENISDREAKRFRDKVSGSFVVYRDPLKGLYQNFLRPASNYLISLDEAVNSGDENLIF